MSTDERRVCLLGAAGVGKTSLVRRFVEGAFSHAYFSTIGVMVDRRRLQVGQQALSLVILDIEGETGYRSVRLRYLRGSAAYVLVVDGTDPDSLTAARYLQEQVADRTPDLPFILLINKDDLSANWRIPEAELAELARTWTVLRTSAKTGAGVEAAFQTIAERLLMLPK